MSIAHLKLNVRQALILTPLSSKEFSLSLYFDRERKDIRRDMTRLSDLGLAKRYYRRAGQLPSAEN